MCYTFVIYVNSLLSRRWRRRPWQPTLVLLPGKMPWTEEPGRQQSMGSHRVRHDWSNLAAAAARRWKVTSHSIGWATHSDFLPKSTAWKAGRGAVRRDRTPPHLGELFQLAPFPVTCLRHGVFVWALPHFLVLQNSPGSPVYFLPQS